MYYTLLCITTGIFHRYASVAHTLQWVPFLCRLLHVCHKRKGYTQIIHYVNYVILTGSIVFYWVGYCINRYTPPVVLPMSQIFFSNITFPGIHLLFYSTVHDQDHITVVWKTYRQVYIIRGKYMCIYINLYRKIIPIFTRV